MTKTAQKGFSLIELIVVITIISVITAVVTVSYRGANLKARDNRRMTDLEKVRVALELYKQSNGVYPQASVFGAGSPLVPDYLQAVPSDPTVYQYVYIPHGNYQYTLYAKMESGGSDVDGIDCDPGTGTVLCNYQVNNQ